MHSINIDIFCSITSNLTWISISQVGQCNKFLNKLFNKLINLYPKFKDGSRANFWQIRLLDQLKNEYIKAIDCGQKFIPELNFGRDMIIVLLELARYVAKTNVNTNVRIILFDDCGLIWKQIAKKLYGKFNKIEDRDVIFIEKHYTLTQIIDNKLTGKVLISCEYSNNEVVNSAQRDFDFCIFVGHKSSNEVVKNSEEKKSLTLLVNIVGGRREISSESIICNLMTINYYNEIHSMDELIDFAIKAEVKYTIILNTEPFVRKRSSLPKNVYKSPSKWTFTLVWDKFYKTGGIFIVNTRNHCDLSFLSCCDLVIYNLNHTKWSKHKPFSLELMRNCTIAMGKRGGIKPLMVKIFNFATNTFDEQVYYKAKFCLLDVPAINYEIIKDVAYLEGLFSRYGLEEIRDLLPMIVRLLILTYPRIGAKYYGNANCNPYNLEDIVKIQTLELNL